MQIKIDGSISYNKIEHQILEKLYRFRLLTTEQLLFIIHPELITDTYPINPKNDSEWRKKYTSKYSRIRKELLNLIEYKFIQSQVYKMSVGRSSTTLFTLRTDRLESVKDLLNIPPNHIGDGWSNNLGDLSSDFYVFPRRIEHHLDSIHFYIKLLYLKDQLSFKHELDYIDNIYSARTYPLPNKELMKLRPDGELKLFGYRNDQIIPRPGLHAWIEIDRSTESSSILKSKFDNYQGYLNHAIGTLQLQLEIPNVILVVTNASTGISRRWHSFINAYESQIGEHHTSFNMIVCNSNTVKAAIESHANRALLIQQLKQNIEQVAQPNFGFKGQLHLGFTKQDISRLQQLVYDQLKWLAQFSITENEPTRKQIYLYLKLDCNESQGISRILDFIRKQHTLPASLNTMEIIPVFYQYSGAPITLPVLDFLTEKENQILSKSLTYVISENEWYAADERQPLSKLTSSNPLVYGLRYINT